MYTAAYGQFKDMKSMPSFSSITPSCFFTALKRFSFNLSSIPIILHLNRLSRHEQCEKSHFEVETIQNLSTNTKLSAAV